MFHEIINVKDKANKDLEEIMKRPQRSYNELWENVHVKEHKFNKELHAKDVKLQSLELIDKTLGKFVDCKNIVTKNQTKALLYE
jgi:hypothetical protein